MRLNLPFWLLFTVLLSDYIAKLVYSTFTDCYDLRGRAQEDCLNGFLASNDTSLWAVDSLSPEEERYVLSLFRKVVKDATDWNVHSGDRQWRQDFFDQNSRREVRAPPYDHFKTFSTNVVMLKNERLSPLSRSKYDILALVHGDVTRLAHNTPNFLVWHSLYLRVFEAAIGCPVPYWDSRLDAEMEDPRRSVVWSPRYFGNIQGFVETGPFANFPTPFGPLMREGRGTNSNSLMKQSTVDSIFQRSRYIDIISPRARFPYNIEFQHNGPHAWVGGHLGRLDSGTFDPVFFCHHAFVDYLWKEFRRNQIRRGVNPYTENVSLSRRAPVAGLPGFYNNDGFSKILYDLSMYRSSPTCSNNCADANRDDLYCDNDKGLCVSREHDIEIHSMSTLSEQMVQVMKKEISVLEEMEQFEPVFVTE